MNVLIISPTKGTEVHNAKAIPRTGETVYHKGCVLDVKEVVWWPTAEVLNKCNSTLNGYHVSELEGDAVIEAMIRTS